MRAITIRQPHAGDILRNGKDVENRTWRTHHRGPLLIHVAARPKGDLPCSTIVGVVNVVDCVWDEYDSPWAMEEHWHWVLDDQRMLDEPVPCSGQLSLWEPPAAAMRKVRRQLPDLR